MKRSAALTALLLFAVSCAQPSPPILPPPDSSFTSPWSPDAETALIAAATNLPQHGINAADLTALTIAPAKEDAPKWIARLDTLAVTLANRLALGATDPTQSDPAWRIPRETLAPNLEQLRALSPAALTAQFENLAPRKAAYQQLQAELAIQQGLTASAETQSRIVRLRATLERWRWLPRTLEPDRIEVHVPQFELRVFRADALVTVHKVIVGAARSPTPSFRADVTAVTINPVWRPPASIARGEIWPLIRRSPERAAALGYRLVDSSGAMHRPGAEQSNTGAMRIIQLPGPANALGRIKLEMANPHLIYVHDTPAQNLFGREKRAFSHGCIRVQAARDLAAALLNGSEAEALDAAIASGTTTTVPLSAAVPIYLLYLTAEPGAKGEIVYSEDIDGRDRRLVREMDRPAAATTPQARATLAPPSECHAMKTL